MTGRVQTNRSPTTGNRPTGRQVGELYVNLADGQLGVINSGGTAQDLIGVTFFSPFSNYVAGNHVIQGGLLYRAMGTITAGSFNPAQWQSISSTSGFLPLGGGTMTGTLTLVGIPSGANDAVPKQYVDGLVVSSGGGVTPNKIINGDMRIDQRGVASNAGVTANGYTIDRWAYSSTVAGKVVVFRSGGAPSGFAYTLNPISQSAYTVAAGDAFYLQQPIEADQITDFAWGPSTTAPQTVTLSFWALTQSTSGTFSGAICNYPATGAPTRSYPFTFLVPTQLLWQKYIITIPADITGTWVMSGNGGGAYLRFDLGSGATFRGAANGTWQNGNFCGATGSVNLVATTGAQLYITGVKLEVGSAATPYPIESVAKRLADCQRYFAKTYIQADAPGTTVGPISNRALAFSNGPNLDSASTLMTTWKLPVTMRAGAGTVLLYSPNTGATGKAFAVIATADVNAVAYTISDNSISMGVNGVSIGARERIYMHATADAEL